MILSKRERKKCLTTPYVNRKEKEWIKKYENSLWKTVWKCGKLLCCQWGTAGLRKKAESIFLWK
jgi:hypothetical protein